MRKNILVSTIGYTPAVVTEAIDMFKEQGVEISEVVVLPTKPVLRSYWALKIDFKYGPYRGSIKLIKRELPFDDILSERESVEFRRILENLLKEKMKEGDVYLSVAGGRKTMPMEAMLVARRLGIPHVYHVIAEEVKGISEKFAILSSVFDLRRYAETGEQPPREVTNFIVNICHPKDLRLHLIKVPTQ